MDATIYHVHTQQYEGPIEVLLRLIEERKLPINEISLAQVTDDYINHMHTQKLSYTESTQFLIIASTLVLIKSRSLLPTLVLHDEEEEDIAELERRLRLYKVFQQLSAHIQDAYDGDTLFMQPSSAPREHVFAPDSAITPHALHESLADIFQELPQHEKLDKASITTVVRIEDMMESLHERIQSGAELSFNAFVKRNRVPRSPEEARHIKVEVVVGFLALLELVRNGILSVMQSDNFEDMNISQRAES